jgi:hypothetical protein
MTDLRHTGNTMAAAQRASLKGLTERMGHSSTRAALSLAVRRVSPSVLTCRKRGLLPLGQFGRVFTTAAIRSR